MPRLAYDTRSGTGAKATLIHDFQLSRDETRLEAVLRKNAEARGVPPQNVDVRSVTLAEYKAITDAALAPARAQREAERAALDSAADEVRTKLGLSAGEVKALAHLLKRDGI